MQSGPLDKINSVSESEQLPVNSSRNHASTAWCLAVISFTVLLFYFSPFFSPDPLVPSCFSTMVIILIESTIPKLRVSIVKLSGIDSRGKGSLKTINMPTLRDIFNHTPRYATRKLHTCTCVFLFPSTYHHFPFIIIISLL